MSDPIILVIVALIILGMGVFGIWYDFLLKAKNLKVLEKKLYDKLEYRRDAIPYLLESYKALESNHEGLETIIEKRSEARDEMNFEKMWEIEQVLEASLDSLFERTKKNEALQKDIGWLEPRTELQNSWEEVTKMEQIWKEHRDAIASKQSKFPYMFFGKKVK
jgi:hypothetical protein